MSDADRMKGGETAQISLKILYTLHGPETQRYIVKPAAPVKAKLFRDIELGVVGLQPCLDAIRDVSPDFSSICRTHSEEYAVYSTDYAEDGLPLQSHGKVSHQHLLDVTGKLCVSKLMREQLELLIHLLPVRKPEELIADYSQKLMRSDLMSDQLDFFPHNMPPLPPPPPSLMNPTLLPPQVQIPPSLSSAAARSDTVLPSSPPVRAKPLRIKPQQHQHQHQHQPAQVQHAQHAQHAQSAPLTANNVAQPPAKRATSPTKAATTRKRRAQSPKYEGEAQCGNCGVITASTWRRRRGADGKGELLCNACGLYYRTKKVMRPRFLWDKSRTRGDQEQQQQQQQQQQQSRSSELPSLPESVSESGPASNHTPAPPAQPQPSSICSHDAHTPQDAPQMLWSRAQSNTFISSDPSDVSDRLVDDHHHHHHPHHHHHHHSHNHDGTVLGANMLPQSDSVLDNRTASQITEPATEPAAPSQATTAPPAVCMPSTPERKTTHNPVEPDSMQKWLGLSTPDQRLGLLMPGSGSARKWLDKAMNPAHFEEVWNSPTPRKQRSSMPDLSMFTSSPPTSSSNMLSEVAEWNLVNPSPGTPQALKFFKGTSSELDMDNLDVKAGKVDFSEPQRIEQQHHHHHAS